MAGKENGYMLLNGEWEGQYRQPGDLPVDFNGIVPGCAHTDLLREGLISDYFTDFQADDCQWIEDANFRYKKTFTYEDDPDNCRLVFKGLDTFCDVFLNGTKVGSADNMFLPYEFDVGTVLVKGENTIEVCFYPPAKKVEGYPEYAHCFSGDRVHIRRMQCTFGWDWVHRFVTMGIMDDVFICKPAGTVLDQIYVTTTHLDQYGAQVFIEGSFSKREEEAWITLQITDPDGTIVWGQKRKAAEDSFYVFASIPDPQLWFPNGYGEQPLYTLTATMTNSRSEIPGGKTIRFGVRTIRILEEIDKPGSDWFNQCLKLKENEFLKDADRNTEFSGFTVLVNGEKIFCKGGNWVPCEPFPAAVRDEKYRELLRIAKEGNINMLRVWGGGLIERDSFYDECDRLGILITQDFQMACATYPEDQPSFLSSIQKEARHAVKKLRNHACIAWWTGDNEIAARGSFDRDDYTGRKTALTAIAPVIRELDPYRVFLHSSPYGGDPFMSATRGITHATFFLSWLNQVIRTSDMSDMHDILSCFLSRFNAETTIMGMPAVSSMKRFLSGDHIYDVKSHRYHMKNHPSPEFNDFGMYDMMEKAARLYLGEFLDDKDRLFKMQAIQYEWVRFFMDLYRQNKWFSSGLLFWMYNDCWPAIGFSMVDYYGNPKAGYYGMKHAARPITLSVSRHNGEYHVCLFNDSLNDVDVTVHVYTQSVKEQRPANDMYFAVHADKNENTCIRKGTPELADADTVLIAEIVGEEVQTRTVYWPKRIADLGLQANRDSVVVLEQTQDSITLKANDYVHMVGLDGDYVFEDNFFVMLPEEVRKISLRPIRQYATTDITVCVL